MAGGANANADAVFAALIFFYAAAVVVAYGGCACWHILHRSLKSWRWSAIKIAFSLREENRLATAFPVEIQCFGDLNSLAGCRGKDKGTRLKSISLLLLKSYVSLGRRSP